MNTRETEVKNGETKFIAIRPYDVLEIIECVFIENSINQFDTLTNYVIT